MLPSELTEATTSIVCSYVSHNQVDPNLIGTLIKDVAQALLARTPWDDREAFEAPKIAVDYMPLVNQTADIITCAACGFQGKMIKRHLLLAHGFTPEEYRRHFKLAADHPIASQAHSAHRSQIAKDTGLGRSA